MPYRDKYLFIFAHPDDETSSSGGTIAKLVKQNHSVYVCTATKGEEGSLGSQGVPIAKSHLPKIREQELREALELYGAHSPIFLGYRDQGLEAIGKDKLQETLLAVISSVRPDFVITFGPSGISRHPDHIAVHEAATGAYCAFHSRFPGCKLLYVAIPDSYNTFNLDLADIERDPNVIIDISREFNVKLTALRNYKSQEDAQILADIYSKLGKLSKARRAEIQAKKNSMSNA